MADPVPRSEMELLAAEYVLGVLDAEERRAAEQLVEADGTMRLLVEEWAGHLEHLNAAYAEAPAPDIWPALDRQLFAARRRRNWLFLLVVAVLAVALVAKVAMWARVLL